VYFWGGNRENTVESAKIGAKIDKVIEKRQFPMIFLQNLDFISFTHIPTDYNHKKWKILKKFGQKAQFTHYI
jgi:hypothetical protein